jgi:hypothetical protein
VLDLSARQREQVEQLARGRRDAYNFALALDRDRYSADLPPADWADLEPDWEAPGWNEARRMALGSQQGLLEAALEVACFGHMLTRV